LSTGFPKTFIPLILEVTTGRRGLCCADKELEKRKNPIRKARAWSDFIDEFSDPKDKIHVFHFSSNY
jgi:hypothetical protein